MATFPPSQTSTLQSVVSTQSSTRQLLSPTTATATATGVDEKGFIVGPRPSSRASSLYPTMSQPRRRPPSSPLSRSGAATPTKRISSIAPDDGEVYARLSVFMGSQRDRNSVATASEIYPSSIDLLDFDEHTTGPEADDWVHTPDKNINDTGYIWTLRGMANLGFLFLMTGSFMTLFLGYPIQDIQHSRILWSNFASTLGQFNSTGQLVGTSESDIQAWVLR